MNNFRVVRYGNSSNGWRFEIEDVLEEKYSECHPFLVYPNGILSSSSVEELREKLKAMLVACDKPVMQMTMPRLEEL